ncbi:MAG: hypothetical protein FWB80_06125 [Defluviitaleaceae bacterium]|nr:hypothetical protein [Defluviitaleaceae bacterium]
MKKICILLTITLLAALIPATPAYAAFDVFTATLTGQMDMSVSHSVDEWGIGYREDASVGFSVNHEAIIFMLFDEPVRFTGNRIGIKTNIPVIGDTDAASTGAFIHSLVIDGVELGAVEVPLINRDGYMYFDIARGYNGVHDVYGFADKRPFSRIELTFVVQNMPLGVEDPVEEPEEEQEEPEIAPISESITEVEIQPAQPPEDEGQGTFRPWVVIVGIVILALIFIGVKLSKKK